MRNKTAFKGHELRIFVTILIRHDINSVAQHFGAWSDETSEKIGKLRANGMSVPEIAEELGVKTNTVWSYLPYSKGMYNQEYPTINAI